MMLVFERHLIIIQMKNLIDIEPALRKKGGATAADEDTDAHVIWREEPDTTTSPKIRSRSTWYSVACPLPSKLSTQGANIPATGTQLFSMQGVPTSGPAMGISGAIRLGRSAGVSLGPEQRRSIVVVAHAAKRFARHQIPGWLSFSARLTSKAAGWRVLLRANGHGFDRSAECGLTAVKFRSSRARVIMNLTGC